LEEVVAMRKPNEIELLIPTSDAADFLDGPRIKWRTPLVLDDGTQVDLNAPGPFDDEETTEPDDR
jgi:hypothetical protein